MDYPGWIPLLEFDCLASSKKNEKWLVVGGTEFKISQVYPLSG